MHLYITYLRKVRRLTEPLVASNDIKIKTRLVALREAGVVQMKEAMRVRRRIMCDTASYYTPL